MGVLLVEHDMQAVFALADRITVLVGGKVIASGPPDAIRGDQEVRAAYLGDEMPEARPA
jgi:branched-chain amino acid transport system ATP-binding protein